MRSFFLKLKFFLGAWQVLKGIVSSGRDPEDFTQILSSIRIIGDAYTNPDAAVDLSSAAFFTQEILNLLRQRKAGLDDLIEMLCEAQYPQGTAARFLANLLTEVSKDTRWSSVDWDSEVQRLQEYGWFQTRLIKALLNDLDEIQRKQPKQETESDYVAEVSSQQLDDEPPYPDLPPEYISEVELDSDGKEEELYF